MTEYGRGPGTEPWHPEDPLYGDAGWGAQQAHAGQQYPYGGQPQHPQYEGWSQDQQPHYGNQQYPQYDGQGQQHFDPQQTGQHPHPQQHQGGWDATGTHGHVPYAADPGDPYGQHPAAYGAEQPDLYGTEDAYPPPQPPGHRDPEPGWDPEGDDGHPVPPGDDDAPAEPAERRGKGRKPVKSKKGRTGCALMVVVLVFGGGLGGVAYFGYQFYKNRFAPAPDYAGSGNGEAVTVEIPKGAGGYAIGAKLKEAGVVQSVDAFVSAQSANPKAKGLQDGVYTLQKHMSAASAVALMLSPKSRDNLVIPEGKRNIWVYEAIDTRLKLAKGTTAKIAKNDWKDLGLPSWANSNKDVKDPLEGFLFPSSYAVAKGMKPKDVLKSMVERSNEQYKQYDLAGKAQDLGLNSPLQVLTVASLVQVEGKYKHDFGKVARVVYNRLKPDNVETAGRLEFDSTVNYLKGQSTLDVGSVADLRKIADPYNTYDIKGLPPGPISNPGSEAIESALNPTPGPWYYFVSINENETVFAVTNEEHNRNVEKYQEARKQAGKQ
ncbi:endolytic transglycosylase MltG [Streptomyces sp. SID2999]|uniref:endolytic transglycosylase MltG n=1 Tax=Streptomyces sp. SID2999 TaxID=2690258 RepID=UPI0013FF26CE|nr:endolytic transglycosylase MltG [Streptomyces sp. SID2999]MYZ09884.1 endolytic transglycosylase MltG [Streptomyces sp. SID2999]